MSADSLDEREWNGIVRTLEELVAYYDRMNRVATLFQADRWRRRAAELSGEGLDILEIGCGPGSFAIGLTGRSIACVDPSEELLRIAMKRLRDRGIDFRLGRAESLPFDDERFDRVFCSFSFRDFQDKRKSLEEMHRVLRRDGLAVILDVAKRRSRLHGALMSWHLRYDVPLIARLVVPRSRMNEWGRNPWKDLWLTYERFQPVEAYAEMMSQLGFADTAWKMLSMGGATLLTGRRR